MFRLRFGAVNMPVDLRFYAELNDFLPQELRQRTITREVLLPVAVKDVVEALGVPHTEVDLIVVNGEPVGFEHRLADGDRVAVYPVFEAIDISACSRLRPEPLRHPRFVADTHLGRLARYLRLLGFDASYERDADDPALADRAAAERRVLLTRDRGLLKRSSVTHGLYVRGTDPFAQVIDIVSRLDLAGRLAPFSRCLECNGRLESVPKAEVGDALPPRVRRDYDEFRRCPGCDRVYWRGSHYDRLARLVDEIRRALES